MGSALTQIDLVICGHVNLLPLGRPAAAELRCPLVLMAYGMDVAEETVSLGALLGPPCQRIWWMSAASPAIG